MISPLKRLYNIEKLLFPEPDIPKEEDIDNFETILKDIYSDIRKEE